MNETTQNHEGYYCQNGDILKGFASKTAFWAAMTVVFTIMVILFNITQSNEDKYNQLRLDFKDSVFAIEKDILAIKGILTNPKKSL